MILEFKIVEVQPNHKFKSLISIQITNFSVSTRSPKCAVYDLTYTAHYGDWLETEKKLWFEIGDLVGDVNKKLVSRMDVAP